MNALAPLAILAAIAFSGRRSTRAPAPADPGISAAELAERIKREADEIVRGKRDAFTPVEPAPVGPRAPAPAARAPLPAPAPVPVLIRPPMDTEAEQDAAARAAVEEFENGSQPARPARTRRTAPVIIPQGPPMRPPPKAPTQRLPLQPITPPVAEPSRAPADIPPGYDPAGARKMAPSLARHLARAKYSYDRPLVKSFQIKAALKPDKIYGGATRGALIYFGAPNAPQALFKPTGTVPYVPPEERLT